MTPCSAEDDRLSADAPLLTALGLMAEGENHLAPDVGSSCLSKAADSTEECTMSTTATRGSMEEGDLVLVADSAEGRSSTQGATLLTIDLSRYQTLMTLTNPTLLCPSLLSSMTPPTHPLVDSRSSTIDPLGLNRCRGPSSASPTRPSRL